MSEARDSCFVRLPDVIRRTGFRWSIVVAAVLAAGTMLMFGVVYSLGTDALFRTADKSVLEQLDLLAARPAELLPFMITSRMRDRLDNPHVITEVGLFDADGKRIVGDIPEIPHALRLDGHVHTEVSPRPSADEPQHERVAGRILPDGRILVVARNVDDLLAMRSSILWTLAFALVPAILLSIAGGVIVGTRTQRRLLALRRTAERIIAGHLDERLAARVPGDDLDQLAAIVNRILDRLEALVHALKGAGEDIAHDIRTPLASVRARLERGREHAESRDQLLAVVDQSIAGIDQALAIAAALLRIAEIEHSQRYAGFAPFDLAEILRDAAEAYGPVAEDKGVRLTLDAAPAAQILGDRDLMLELVLNLVDNAVKFTPSGGSVRLDLAATPDGPLLRVADSGPGIPEDEMGLVFRRFYRSDKSRSSKGHGLGLSLVAAIAGLHGFRLSLHSAKPGCIVELQCWRDADPRQQPAAEMVSAEPGSG